ncbi:unnamed protein product [Rotaria socialis]|uniref:Nicastrin n=1 Tax=Rotaria socialis TaxID=392032 RepID=A0A818B833_9BILA|nr:unnamed protein product [Rotaria socialis]CAF4407314.1 unnamed protein product [Rotaria socialis]
MHLLFLLASLYLQNVFVFCSQPKRVVDQMYISFDHARYCVRRLNGTHEIGCQSAIRGNSGRMFMIDNDEEFNSYLNDNKTMNSFNAFIIVLNVNLFDSNHIDRLMKRLDTKLNGLLLYLKSKSARPLDFSPDDQCPNHRNSFYLNQTTETINWNRHGTGLFFRSFPFPIMLIEGEDDYQRLLKFYQQFNNSQSTPACGLELKTFQSAAHTTKTCMRRNDISHSIIDFQETFCDPIGGLNIYSKLPQSITIVPDQRPLKSVILILASTDSFQMFLETKRPTGGSQQPATALITFLALAHLIGQEQDELKKQNKEIIFVTLDGDAMDYSASYKFMFDMKNGDFPLGNKNEQPIETKHIHSIIEFQSLSMNSELWLHSYPSKLIDQKFIDSLIKNNRKINKIPIGTPLPPASSQIFLQQTSSSFPAYILASINQSQILNHYYHSFFDDSSTLSINISTLEYNTTTQVSQWIKQIVEPFAQTLIEWLVDVNKTVHIKQEIINNLVYCILKNMNCPLIHNVTNQSVGNTFQPFDQTSMPFSINTYPTSITPTFPFIQYVLGYFLRDRSFDLQNLTETSCKKRADNDSFCSYTFVDGYLPSMNSNNTLSSGYCVRSYLRSVQSISPAFIIPNYDLSKTEYPTWTESRWTTISLRLFLIPTRTHEIVTFIIGMMLTVISFFFLCFLRYYTKVSLLQPSSS